MRRYRRKDPQCGSGDEVALEVEGVVNRTVQAEEVLGRSSPLEPLKLALASSDCLMRILRPIVLSKPLLMPTGQLQMPERGGVGAQLVGDYKFWCETLLLEQLAHQLQRRPDVASALNQHVENLPSWSTARQRYIRLPGRRWRSRRAIAGPNISIQRRTVS
jgi:hypothetical protein